jgi:hypothetical protein
MANYRVEAMFNFIFFIPLSVLNYRLYKKKTDSFQLKQVVLLQMCFTFVIIANIFKFLGNHDNASILTQFYYFFSFSFYALDCVVHTLFAVKYWTTSQFIKRVLDEKPVDSVVTCAWIITLV